MKKIFLFILTFHFFLLHAQQRVAKWGVCPPGWNDFKMGLVCENYPLLKSRIKQAIKENTKLEYRYIYINNGVDPNTNAISWLFTQWTDYAKESIDLGVSPAYVIYMLQEEGGRKALLQHINDPEFMKKYYTSVRTVAEKSNGMKAIFILEPDTWGYYLQDGFDQNLNMDPTKEPAHVNDLGAGYDWLQGIPNNMSGVVQGLIKTIRTYAPDAYCGILMSHWSIFANGITGAATADGKNGMVYWNTGDIDYSAQKNAEFGNLLLGTGDRGDFIGVEKNGWSAGRWKVQNGVTFWYWGDKENANWVHWVTKLSQAMDIPALGWQISIGHPGLPNSNNSYEDTFFPYFYSHTQDFMNAGLLGFLVGKGLADDTDFSNLNGNDVDPNDGQQGDRGWFFEQMKAFDKKRPYICLNTPVNEINDQLTNTYIVTGDVLKEITWLENEPVKTAFVYTIDGRLINTLTVLNNKTLLNTSTLATGLYLITTNRGTIKLSVFNP